MVRGTIQAAPNFARIAAGIWWRAASFSVEGSVRAARRLGQAAVEGESTGQLVEELRSELREGARQVLGLAGGPEVAGKVNPDATPERLRERGAELLTRSAEVGAAAGVHPAYDRMLTQLSPDEARVLRLLATKGPQAAVDVRTWRPFGFGSELVAQNLTMLGREAGCRHPDRVPMYLNNLFRLGLIWYSKDALDDMTAYQVLEAQPEVQEEIERAGTARTVRQSIRLTPFGEDFCRVCLPEHTGEFDALRAEAVARELERAGGAGSAPQGRGFGRADPEGGPA